MKLGKCPICGKELHYYKSLDTNEWKRYDLDCKTKGCLIHELEWNYSDLQKLISVYKSSMDLKEKSCKCNDKALSPKPVFKPDDVAVDVKKDTSKPVVNQKPAKVTSKSKKRLSVHYSVFIKQKRCSSWQKAKELTDNKNDITCSRCLKLLPKPKRIRT